MNNGYIYISVGTSTVDDWKTVRMNNVANTGNVVNNQRSNVAASTTIDVDNSNRVVINSGVATDITTLSNGVDRQEIYLINTMSVNMTIKHNIGNIRLRDKVNKVLTQYQGVTLININAVWFEK